MIHPSAPVNRNAPLNQGRVMWLMTTPSRGAGPTWLDLCNRSNATFSGYGSNLIWSPSTRRASGMQVEGPSSAYVDTGKLLSDLIPGVAAGTVSLWFKPTGLASSSTYGLFSATTGGTAPMLDAVNYLGTYYIGFYTGAEYRVTFAADSNTWQEGIWTHLLVTWKPNYLEVFLNGKSKGTTTPAAGPSTNNNLKILVDGDGGVTPAGPTDGFSVWDRYMRAEEVSYLYREEISDYPTTLNRPNPFRGLIATASYGPRIRRVICSGAA